MYRKYLSVIDLQGVCGGNSDHENPPPLHECPELSLKTTVPLPMPSTPVVGEPRKPAENATPESEVRPSVPKLARAFQGST